MQGFDRIVTRQVIPVVEAAPDYADGDVMGGKQSITDAARSGAFSGVISSITVFFKSTVGANLRILFFNADPSSTTFTENGAINLNAADYAKLIGFVDFDITADPTINIGTPDVICKTNINMPFVLSGSTTLYAVCVAAAAFNLASTSDLIFTYGIIQD